MELVREEEVSDVPACLYEEEVSDEADEIDDSVNVLGTFNSSAHLDNSLTNLQWLHSLQLTNQRENAPPTPPSDALTSRNTRPKKRKRPRTKPVIDPADLPENPTAEDYRTNKNLKPPHSYARLIYEAIKAENKPLITLSAIYNYIKTNFRYYCFADCSWQNSVRHNLSLNKCFQKVPREKGDRGKGGFWMLAPGHEELFEQAGRRKRGKSCSQRSPSNEEEEPLAKRRRRPRANSESTATASSPGCRHQSKAVSGSDSAFIKVKTEPGTSDESASTFSWRSVGNGMISDCSGGRTSTPLRQACALPAEINSSIRALKMELPESPPESATDGGEIPIDVFEELLHDEEMELYWRSEDTGDIDGEMSQFAEGLLTSDLLLAAGAMSTAPQLAVHGLAMTLNPCRPSDLAPSQPPVTIACSVGTPVDL